MKDELLLTAEMAAKARLSDRIDARLAARKLLRADRKKAARKAVETKWRAAHAG